MIAAENFNFGWREAAVVESQCAAGAGGDDVGVGVIEGELADGAAAVEGEGGIGGCGGVGKGDDCADCIGNPAGPVGGVGPGAAGSGGPSRHEQVGDLQ